MITDPLELHLLECYRGLMSCYLAFEAGISPETTSALLGARRAYMEAVMAVDASGGHTLNLEVLHLIARETPVCFACYLLGGAHYAVQQMLATLREVPAAVEQMVAGGWVGFAGLSAVQRDFLAGRWDGAMDGYEFYVSEAGAVLCRRPATVLLERRRRKRPNFGLGILNSELKQGAGAQPGEADHSTSNIQNSPLPPEAAAPECAAIPGHPEDDFSNNPTQPIQHHED